MVITPIIVNVFPQKQFGRGTRPRHHDNRKHKIFLLFASYESFEFLIFCLGKSGKKYYVEILICHL